MPKEIHAGERRVAATPHTAKRLIQLGFTVWLESGAGLGSYFCDTAYEAVGVQIVTDVEALWANADILLKVRPPEMHSQLGKHEADLLREGGVLVGFLFPAQNEALLQRLAARKATVLAMDMIPRISRAQKMDALSSMANISGYRAVIEAANAFGCAFMGQMTAAGKISPAKVLIIGAGVAGLSAIGVAKGLGAIVRAFDTRSAAREQVESLGAQFLSIDVHEDGEGRGGYAKEMSKSFVEAEKALFAAELKEVNIVITTAQIPGKKAPVLLTREMVEGMQEGSVIVDLAAEQGGNCELTEAGKTKIYHGVTVVGFTDLPSRLPSTSSQLYGTNLYHLLRDMGGNEFKININDDVVRKALALHEGTVTYSPPPVAPPPQAPTVSSETTAAAPVKTPQVPASGFLKKMRNGLIFLAIALFLGLVGMTAPPEFLPHFSVFVLACIVGWQVIWNVTPALHTPLMSVTNAISGIIIIGGILELSTGAGTVRLVMGALAVFVAMINVAGGFFVTRRMLLMFKKNGCSGK